MSTLDNKIISDNKIIIVIPVYNHVATLKDVVSKALQYCKSIIVIDDGSSEPCIESISHLNVPVLYHHENRGKGAAIKTAAAVASSMGYTHMITIDADGQHDPSDIPAFIDAINAASQDIIIGKRNFDTVNVPKSSVFGRAFSNFWLRVQTGTATGDVQSGFRAYPLFIFDGVPFNENRFAFEVEVLVKSVWGGVEIKDIDISVIYQKGKKRISHFNFLRDNFALTKLNTRLTLRSFVPMSHKPLKPGVNKPKLSILRPVQSLQVLAESGLSPARLSMSGAAGVFIGALPLIACHTVFLLFTAGYFRLSKVTALAASQICMPPFMPALCIEVGYYMRNGHFLTDISLQTLGYEGVERLFEWFLGSLVVAPLTALIVGGVIFVSLYFLQPSASAK
ncbi:Glycosyl transferase family 2 [Desulfamplus magnetovallimortis]|uniref:Glycosyl transferase family 2 n=1 Tax=Desulfamplus magnetovallimortis TaxID=1246637 RepID=A0A1W1H9P3_9BACT|nr:DUF2062 domain-containing protein [Desulfamplus magnetovallimortis]SLM29164.1 Glycosyl transferase family 2 [Desulfamplus magnetovallimortis]